MNLHSVPIAAENLKKLQEVNKMSVSYVKCKACGKVFDERKLIWDGDEEMDFCPHCGEGNSTVAVSEQVLVQGNYSFVANKVFFTEPYIIDRETPKRFYSGKLCFLKSEIGIAKLLSLREYPYIKVIAHSEDEICDIIAKWFKKRASSIKKEEIKFSEIVEPTFRKIINKFLIKDDLYVKIGDDFVPWEPSEEIEAMFGVNLCDVNREGEANIDNFLEEMERELKEDM